MIAITAPTWWRATKEASCIVCQECREKLRHGGHRLHYCEHMRTRSTAPPRLVLRHRLPSAFTVTMVQWICTVGLQETHRRWGERGGWSLLFFPAPFWQYVNLKVKKSALRCYLKKKKKKQSDPFCNNQLRYEASGKTQRRSTLVHRKQSQRLWKHT